jgi:hypothetical protein
MAGEEKNKREVVDARLGGTQRCSRVCLIIIAHSAARKTSRCRSLTNPFLERAEDNIDHSPKKRNTEVYELLENNSSVSMIRTTMS